MTDLQHILLIIARILLASYFLKAGISNLKNFSKLVPFVASKKIPLPGVAMAAVVFVQIVGSLMVIFNVYAAIGAIGLLIFTILANVFICNYWTMQGIQRRNINFLFYANIAVIGGLLLIISL